MSSAPLTWTETRLMTNRERRRAFLEDKVDYLIEMSIYERNAWRWRRRNLSMRILHEKLHAAHIVVGTDFNFGSSKERKSPDAGEICSDSMAIQLMWSRRSAITRTGRSAAPISGKRLARWKCASGRQASGVPVRDDQVLWSMDSSLEERLDFRQ